MPSLLEENKRIVREVMEAQFRGDYAALAPHPGMAETRRFFPVLMRPFPDLHGEVVRQVAEGELVASFARMTGTQHAPWLGAPATGPSVTFDVFSIDRVIDGLIVEHNATADFLRPLLQLGAIPAPDFERS